MRVLGSKQNTLKLNDNISGSELELYYRQPSTKERQAYQAQAFPRKGSKVKVNLVATQIKFGKRIITGFEEGNFGMIEDGKTVVFSADPDSKNYRKDWKDLLEKHASDILMILAARSLTLQPRSTSRTMTMSWIFLLRRTSRETCPRPRSPQAGSLLRQRTSRLHRRFR